MGMFQHPHLTRGIVRTPKGAFVITRGLVEVPDEEFDSMGANVLAIAPRHAVMVAGNPRTRARLEAADVRVDEYRGHEISLKGGGGPTCLTRPIARVSS
jgi:arginine deiminase